MKNNRQRHKLKQKMTNMVGKSSKGLPEIQTVPYFDFPPFFYPSDKMCTLEIRPKTN